MDYNETVSKVMVLLKDKKVCLSSRKSHKACYDSLSSFMHQNDEAYSETIREAWIADIKEKMPRQRSAIWIQYVFQLEEMDSTGTISDWRLYLNRSCYEKVPLSWKNSLDLYLDNCKSRYTDRTLTLTCIYCSEGIFYLNDLGVQDISELTYDSVIKLIRTNMYCSEDTKGLILNNVARMIDFLAHKGLCSTNFKYLFNAQLFPHISMISEFSTKNKTLLKNIGSFTANADEVFNSITPFMENLKSHGYVGTTLKLAKHALTALYVFLDMHHLGFRPDIMWIWFSEIKGHMGHSWLHWRRVLKFYEEFIQYGDISPNGKYKYHPVTFDLLPLWCQETITGFLEQKKKEFRAPGTIRSYRISCARFCQFLIEHGCDGFEQISPTIIKEFSRWDQHSTFKGRSTRFVIIRGFLVYLEEKGYTNTPRMDACLMSGSAPENTIVDVLTKDQIKRIEAFRKCHTEPIELRDTAIVLLGLKMGLRTGDVLSLRFNDIDWKKRQITIVMKKTKTQITLPMPVEVGNSIYSYIISGRPESKEDVIFVRAKAPYGKLTGKVCTKALWRILPDRIKVKGGGFHVTRRTFATNLLRNHASIDDVMDALGHHDSTSVMKYLVLDDERSQKCALSLGDLGITLEGSCL